MISLSTGTKRILMVLTFLFWWSSFAIVVSALGTEGSPESEHEFVRCLPDMKVLLRPGQSATTSIDLKNAYQSLEGMKDSAMEFELANGGKSKVVDAEIDTDGCLHLYWKDVGKNQLTLRVSNPVTGQIYYDKFQLEAWEANYAAIFFSVLGGLGIFLLGMKFMSDSLQIVAGPSLRKLIATVTDNRFAAVLVGFVVTSIIQSSSVTTVMVVGFVNSQIMTLSQAIGVIMGANIGTTFTGWILSLNLGKYGLPIFGAAVLVYLFTKIERTRFLAMGTMGIGMVFFGLELMQSGFAPLRDLPAFSAWMESFSADTLPGILLCVAVGCGLTLIVQSSSATLGITMSLAAIGVIRFETAAALVLGENIGTTITAVLASIGSSTNARRAAYFHVLFNTLGVCWAVLAFRWVFMPAVLHIVGTNPETGVIRDPMTGIALTHTLFNTINTLLFLPFTNQAAKLLNRLVPDKPEQPEEKSRITALNLARLDPPAMAVELSRTEICRMGESCTKLLEKVGTIIGNEEIDHDLVDRAFHQEELLDTLQDETIEFTSALLTGNISHDIAEQAQMQLRMADEIESISDYLITILKSDLKMREDGLAFPEMQKKEFAELHSMVSAYISMIIRFYTTRRKVHGELMAEVQAQGRTLTRKAKSIRDQFLKQMNDERYDPKVVIAFNTQLNAYRRVREHAQNVAEAMAGIK